MHLPDDPLRQIRPLYPKNLKRLRFNTKKQLAEIKISNKNTFDVDSNLKIT